MNNFTKKRAPQNRTLTITEKEIIVLSEQLIRLEKKMTVNNLMNKIINQDSFEAIKYLPDQFVDLLFIDPPYNLTKNFAGLNFTKMTEEKYEDWVDSWLSVLIKILKKDASIYFCSDWKSSGVVSKVLSKYFIIRNRITWEREKGRGAKKNWKNSSEDIWFCTLSDNYKFNVDDVKLRRNVIAPYKLMGKPKDWNEVNGLKYRETFPSNIWNDITIPFWSMTENTDHPTQKPEKLLAKILLASSDESDFVFDPFIGSGTAAVVASKLNRIFCGIEVNQNYCCLALKRLEAAKKDKSIQGYKNGVFWERNSLKDQK